MASCINLEDIESFEFVTEEFVYDITVQDNHCFYIYPGKEILVHNSGKTFGLMQCAIFRAVTMPKNQARKEITIVGQDIPNLKAGPMRDMESILSMNPHLSQYIKKFNTTDRIYYFWNGAIIEFKSYEDEQGAKQGKRWISFFNEANGIPYPIYWQVSTRTYGQVWIDFNPTAEFWAHTEVWKPGIIQDGEILLDELGEPIRAIDPKVKLFKSNWRHNQFLDQKVIDKIEAIKVKDPELYKIYGMGEVGNISGLVFKNVEIIRQWPEEILANPFSYKVAQGLDFGWVDPCAFIRRAVKDNCLYLDEIFYAKGLKLGPMSELIKNGTTPGTFVWADSARMDNIAELVELGCEVWPVKKNPGSILSGLDQMHSYDKIYVTSRSVNLRKEFARYVYSKDKNAENKPMPIDAWNHGIDAVRYAELMDRYVYATFELDVTSKSDDPRDYFKADFYD